MSDDLFCVGGYRCASVYDFDIVDFGTVPTVWYFLIFNFMTFANSQERESEQIINLLSSEEATTFKARGIALYSALKVELADGDRRQSTCYRSYRSRDVKLRSIKQPVSHS